MPYPGGKAGPGVFQRLINEIPPHRTYIAACAGHDAIAQFKRPAERTILIDLDPEPLDWWTKYCLYDNPWRASDIELHQADCIQWLRVHFGLTRYGTGTPARATRDRTTLDPETFVYIDPPYLMSTRTSGAMYRHEFTIEQHKELLEVADRLPCRVMISGYHSQLYEKRLVKGWRSFTYEASVRSGDRRTEWCWCNFEPPKTLHDTRFVGNDKRQRENVRRRIKRLSANLMALKPHERQAVLDAIKPS